LPGANFLRCYFGPAAGSFVAQLASVLSSRPSFIFSILIFAARLGQLIHLVSSQALAFGIGFRSLSGSFTSLISLPA
jgi:hypothetical protein